ncbi:hypothetical protein S819_23570 [Salmonella enterica]|nr:hypothetical protein [Salmonella enterica]
MITSIHITTSLNYRISFSVRSDFLEYHNFPEVYHAQEIIISLFSAPARRITEKGVNTLYMVISRG